MAVIGNAPFQGLVSGGEILDASIEGVDLSTSAIAARLGYTPVDPGAASFTANVTINDNSANAALRITQIGTGNALLVEDSANPDATPFVIDASGNVIVGDITPITGSASYIPPLQVSTGNTNNSGVGVNAFSSGSGSGYLHFNRSKSSTVGTNTLVTSGETLGNIVFAGADGTGFIRAATIQSIVDGTPGTNDMPGRLVFGTTADGASSPTERMRISSTGQTTISGNAIISVTDNTNAALRITQLGTGNALLVEDTTNPDSTPFVIDASGNTVVGSTAPIATVSFAGGAITPLLQVQGTGLNSSSAGVSNWSGTAASASSFVFSKSNSGTIGTRGAVASATNLGSVNFAGDDGTNFIPAASILVVVDGTPGTNDMPGRLVFNTTADGASSPTERMRVDSSGRLQVATTNSTATNAKLVVGTGLATSDARVVINTANTDISALLLSNWDGTTTSYGPRIDFDNSGRAAWFIGTQNAGTGFDIGQTVGSPYVRITAAGNLGIGTTAPATKLHVFQRSDAGAAPNTPEIRIEHQDINAVGTSGSNGGVLSFVNIQQNNTGWATDRIWGRINFSPSQPTSGVAQLGASILAAADGALGGQQSSTYLAFYTSDATNGGNNAERVRIDGSGNLTLGNAVAGVNRQFSINGVVNKAARIAFQESGATKWYIGSGAASENGNFEIYHNTTGNNYIFTPAGTFSVAGSLRVMTTTAGNIGGIAASYAGSASYPTLFSDAADRWFMHINPHIAYTQNGVNGFTGTMTGSTIRMSSDASSSNYWDVGVGTNAVGTDKFSIGRGGANKLSLDTGGNLTTIGSINIGPSTGANSLSVNLTNNPDSHGVGTEGSQLTLGGSTNFAVKWFRLNTFNAGYLSFSTHVGGVFAGERAQLDANGAFRPTIDNSYSLGASSFRWGAIYVSGGTVSASDEREKTQITNSQLGLTFINSLRPVSYKWKVGGRDVRTDFEAGKDEAGNYTQIVTDRAGIRTHFGLIAQEVKQALGTQDFGGYVYDLETDKYALRYEQFISPLIKAVQELSQQVEALKAELAALK